MIDVLIVPFCEVFGHCYRSGSVTIPLRLHVLACQTTSETTANSILRFFGGALIGVIVQAPIANRFGRRAANGVAALLLIFSSALQAGSTNIAMFLAGRTISGFGAAMCFSNTPTYTAELATPHNRGLLVGSQGLCVVGSYIVSAVLGLAFYFVNAVRLALHPTNHHHHY